jgi:uncharacterized protein
VEDERTYAAFIGDSLVASGPLEEVLTAVKSRFDQDAGALLLIFEDRTGRQVDFDLRGPLTEVLARALPKPARIGPGRPKLGVIAREVSLLPRHWEWLELQPNGASAALRRLVDQARKAEPGEQRVRLGIEAAGRFLSAMAGNLPGYEEATRALYGRKGDRFDELIRDWPQDIRVHAERLIRGLF